MTVKENKALLRRYGEEVFGKGNVAVSDEILAADYVHHDPGVPPGREGRKQLAEMHHMAWSDLDFKIEDIVAEGDQVALRWSCSATHTGEWMGIPPTGKRVTWSGIGIHRVKDGKMVESWDMVDNLGLMQQLGVVQPPGQ
jgi:steroid delta-isomerase-like uncharacterized protein